MKYFGLSENVLLLLLNTPNKRYIQQVPSLSLKHKYEYGEMDGERPREITRKTGS